MNIEMKGKEPKVSIVITCFNLGKYLDSSVNSALNQTYKNVEIILVDDGSTDQDTKDILSKWKEEKRVKLLQIPNGGVANARNVGIKESSGEYVCCLDADDKLDPEYIKKTVELFQSVDEKIGIVTTWVKKFENENTIWKVEKYNTVEMLWSNSIHIASMFRKDIFEKIGGYDTTMLGYQDWDLWLSFMEEGYRYEVVEEPLFLYRVRNNSMITASDRKRIDIYKYLVKKHKDLYVKNAPELIVALESKRYSVESFLEIEKERKIYLERRNRSLEMEISSMNKSAERLKNRLEYRKIRGNIWFRNLIKNTYKYISFIKAYIQSFIKRKSLNKESFKSLTLDVFDTLVRRDIYPEEIKLAVAQYISLKFNNKASTSEEIYKKRLDIESGLFQKQGDYKLEEVITLLLNELDIEESNTQEVCEYEISLEKKAIRKDGGIEKFLGDLLDIDNKYILSDFYIPKKFLLPLINNFYPTIEKGYVSCDLNKTKANGELFKEFLKRESMDYSDLLHIGDSPYSDVNMARVNGIKALRYFNLSEELARRNWSDKWDIRKYVFPYGDDIKNNLSKVEVKKDLNKKQRELYKLGVKYSPIFYGLVLNILESAKREGIDTVHYFTREGVFFKNIHDLILKNRKYLNLKSEILEVSRVATFFVSLSEFTKENLQRMWNQYKEQTPKSFFKSLGIPIDNVKKYLDKYSIEEERVSSLATDEKFDNLFRDTEFLAFITNELELKKDVFSKYLASKGLVNEDKRYMIVDIGWRGSIQDNLAYFLNKSEIHGKYLGLHSSYYNSPQNVLKSAYGPNYIDDSLKTLDIVNWTGVWEMLTNSPMGSTHRYEEKDGVVRPIFKEDEYETRVHNEFIKYFQMGVLDSIDTLDNFMELHAISSEELRPYVLNLMKDLVYTPEYIITEAYFNLNHNETFGLGTFTNMGERAKLNNRNILKLLISRDYRKNFYHDAIETSWRNGYWKYNRINGIMNLLSKVRYILTGKL